MRNNVGKDVAQDLARPRHLRDRPYTEVAAKARMLRRST